MWSVLKIFFKREGAKPILQATVHLVQNPICRCTYQRTSPIRSLFLDLRGSKSGSPPLGFQEGMGQGKWYPHPLGPPWALYRPIKPFLRLRFWRIQGLNNRQLSNALGLMFEVHLFLLCREGVDSSAKFTAPTQLNMPDKTRKRQNEAISRKKKTIIKNIHKLGKLPGIDLAFTICQNGQYTTYQSADRADFPPSKKQLVSRPQDSINKPS